MLLGQEVRAVNGKGHLEAVTVEDLHSGGRRRLAAGALVVLIGATPTPIGWQQDRLDPNGFGRDPFLLETSRPGVSAVGDVRAGGAGANGSGHLCAGAQSVTKCSHRIAAAGREFRADGTGCGGRVGTR